jgi:hypothetical protein
LVADASGVISFFYIFFVGLVRHLHFFKIFLKRNIVGVGIMILLGPCWNYFIIISVMPNITHLRRFFGSGFLMK